MASEMMMERLILPGQRTGIVTAPPSKSWLHRALICGALGNGITRIGTSALSEDVKATIACLTALGAEITYRNGEILVSPIHKPKLHSVLPCGESGSTLRFLLPLVGVLDLSATFEMQGRLAQRPMDPYLRVLEQHGMVFRKNGRFLHACGKLSGGHYALPGNISSQYFTGLLLSLPLLPEDSCLSTAQPLDSGDYVTMTLRMMETFGVTAQKQEECFINPGGQAYQSRALQAEGDYSSAAAFLCMGALSSRGILVQRLDKTFQGDQRIIEMLRCFGARVLQTENGFFAQRNRLQGQVVDASMVPDLIPVMCALAAYAEGETRIVHAERLRFKESDRIFGIRTVLSGLGAAVAETEDGLVIHGKRCLAGGNADPLEDHRLAMMAAVAACGCEKPVRLQNGMCVAKSYPQFWQDFDGLGVYDGQ